MTYPARGRPGHLKVKYHFVVLMDVSEADKNEVGISMRLEINRVMVVYFLSQNYSKG